jgi:DNA-binding CsgD family transcriptional regulator
MPAGVERRPAERIVFDALAPHLRQMFRLSSLFGEADGQRDALETVIRNSGQAVALLEADGAIRWVSEAALSLSAQNDGLSCDGRRLGFVRSDDQRDFDRMLALARQPDLTGGAGATGQLVVARPSGKRPYALQLTPAPVAFRRQFHGRCAFIVTIRDTAVPTDPRPELWRALFGLTPTEARVAGLSMRGLDDAAIAGALGLGIGTVRTHHKHLLSKTETHSKAELAHLLTSLA